MKIRQLINNHSDLDQKDIILLLENVFNSTYSALMLSNDIVFSLQQQKAFEEGISRLKQHEPIQYILGSWDFIDLKLKVDSRALIPRPETEILALEGVDIAKRINTPRILDAGCGTGCIGLYIKHSLPDSDVTLCDVSPEAVALSKENAKALNLNVKFKIVDLREIDEKYDLIISNPPYITKDDMKLLDKSVIDFEPRGALCGGEDGLEFYRILSEMNKNLKSNGFIAVEIGINQNEKVQRLFLKNFDVIRIINDFAGIPRVITAKRK